MPRVVLEYDQVDHGSEKIKVRGCVWAQDAWAKVQRMTSKRALRLLDSDDLTPVIYMVSPPEVTGATFTTSNRARGCRGDWEIVFEAPGGMRGGLQSAIAEVREAVTGEFVDTPHDLWALARRSCVRQILTTRGHGLRRSRGARKDEMSADLLPTLRTSNGVYEVVFERS